MRERAQKQRQQVHANGNGGNGKQHQILALDCIALHTHLNDEKYVRNWIECIRIYSLKHLCTNTLCVTCHSIVIKFKFSSSQWNLPNRLDQRRKFHFRFLSLSLSFSAFVVLVSFFCWWNSFSTIKKFYRAHLVCANPTTYIFNALLDMKHKIWQSYNSNMTLIFRTESAKNPNRQFFNVNTTFSP